MGTLFVLALIASIETLPTATQELLSSFVHTVVLLQSPSLALGVPIPSGWLIPHTDPNIAPESRGFAFAKWVSSYFIHGDLKSATVETLSPEDLFAMTDFGPAEKYDNIIGLPPFAGAVFKQTNKALFDPTVRAAWSQTRFWTLYGSAEPWPIIYGAWFLEAQSHEMNNPELVIEFKVIDGSNHFLVWEDPEKAINELKECFSI
ncbi:hypothetical protein B0H13DRAFT_2361314 [Mycena leptocephala]|nr:hypothetical protein B0H13DRAFT_2361314 [Mycena leptocephala]